MYLLKKENAKTDFGDLRNTQISVCCSILYTLMMKITQKPSCVTLKPETAPPLACRHSGKCAYSW